MPSYVMTLLLVFSSIFAFADKVYTNPAPDKCALKQAVFDDEVSNAAVAPRVVFLCQDDPAKAESIVASKPAGELLKEANQFCRQKYCPPPPPVIRAEPPVEKSQPVEVGPCKVKSVRPVALNDLVGRCDNSPGSSDWKSGQPFKRFRVECSDQSIVDKSFFLNVDKESGHEVYRCQDMSRIKEMAQKICDRRVCEPLAANLKKIEIKGRIQATAVKKDKAVLRVLNEKTVHELVLRESQKQQFSFVVSKDAHVEITALCSSDALKKDNNIYYLGCSVVQYLESNAP